MTSRDSGREQPRGGGSGKREAILAGALSVFARDGYAGASIDAISAEAGVSTRTIYNHFTDKAGLFQQVLEHSSTSAAEAQIRIIDRHLRKVTDLEADLVDFGRAWVTPMPTHADHFRLVQRLGAESGSAVETATSTWRQAGPVRVRAELSARLGELASQRVLIVDDPDRAALHLMLLVSAGLPTQPGAAPTPHEITEAVTAGVRAFLHGYGT
ncbi:TetR/AcrR family transcriptional regulator [Micromonospora ureilytica]|uniref:AcrR family transcriptional regulator n=1 Tax=Micromonospora ureilytica TaxID=709868 RepID=A0ABS0JC96_9ACTN|nr:TetR/AcrR family transcriptional regulator [Micromonospora ureilytica]MBG6064619.1 AcrR family transcriptional regulator [Micromonospora ureilytica]